MRQHNDVNIASHHGAFTLGLTNWSTSTATLAITATTLNTRPTTIDSTTTSSNKVVIPAIRNQLILRFLGRDTNNDEIRYMVSMVSSTRSASNGQDVIWRSDPIVTVDGLISSAVKGVASGPVLATDYYCDTLTVSGVLNATGTYDNIYKVPQVSSPGNDLAAGYLIIDPLPCEYIMVEGDIDGGSGTAGTAWNVEYAWI